jgi:hypothetical protein
LGFSELEGWVLSLHVSFVGDLRKNLDIDEVTSTTIYNGKDFSDPFPAAREN